MPTRTQQADFLFVRNASHGDARHADPTAEECFDFVPRTDLADRLRA
jgi:hypothetical protein